MTDTMTDARPFALGDRVTYTDGGRDYTGTVRGIYHDESETTEDRSLWITGDEYPHAYSLATGRQGQNRTFAPDAQDDEQGHWVSVRWDNPRHADPEPEPEPPVPSMTAEEITRLQAQVSDLTSQVETARTVIRQIGTALQETADLHEWCGEYDRRASQLFDSLPGRYGFDVDFQESAIREREYEVCVHWTVTHSTTVSVNASSQEAAVEMVQEDPTEYVEPLDRYTADSDSVSWDEVHAD